MPSSARTPQIISASYKTDLPMFYGEWFMKRIEEGYALYRNPYWSSTQDVVVSLKPEDVACFVFWSKNYQPFLLHLPAILARYRAVFHYTINGLPKALENHVRDPLNSADTLCRLAERVTPEQVFWRFDPILLANLTPDEHYLEVFTRIASRVKGATRRCYVKFLNVRPARGSDPVRTIPGLKIEEDPSIERRRALIGALADIARGFGIEIHACREDGLFDEPPLAKQTSSREPANPWHSNVRIGSCIDRELLTRLFPDVAFARKRCGLDKDNGCYCLDHRDIGAYHTCPHGCIYCYAVKSPEAALAYFRGFRPDHDNMVQDRPKRT